MASLVDYISISLMILLHTALISFHYSLNRHINIVLFKLGRGGGAIQNPSLEFLKLAPEKAALRPSVVVKSGGITVFCLMWRKADRDCTEK